MRVDLGERRATFPSPSAARLLPNQPHDAEFPFDTQLVGMAIESTTYLSSQMQWVPVASVTSVGGITPPGPADKSIAGWTITDVVSIVSQDNYTTFGQVGWRFALWYAGRVLLTALSLSEDATVA